MNTQSKNRKQGDKAEALVEKELKRMGFLCVEKQATPIKITRVISRRGGMMRADIFYSEKVTGDFKCIGDNGRYVSVEVKRTTEPKLSLSAFKPHQLRAMKAVYDAGGEALIAWVYENEIMLLNYLQLPEKGKPLNR